MAVLSKAPWLWLGGLGLANFSSAHTFKFRNVAYQGDPWELEGCETDRVEALMLQQPSDVVVRIGRRDTRSVVKAYVATQIILDELERLEKDQDNDVVIVPRVVKEAVANEYGFNPHAYGEDTEAVRKHFDLAVQRGYPGKIRTIMVYNRSNQVNYADRFCL
jgi:hypothetical protein